MENSLVLSPSLLSTLTIEGLKYVIRKWIKKEEEFQFSPTFYKLVIPFVTAVWQILMGEAGWSAKVAFDLQSLLLWGLTIVITLVLYNAGISPLKESFKYYEIMKDWTKQDDVIEIDK